MAMQIERAANLKFPAPNAFFTASVLGRHGLGAWLLCRRRGR
jgi:hypothetical protein